MSCPELARRALLRPEGIQSEEVETPVTGGVMARLNFTRSVNPDRPEHPSDRFFQPLRDFTLRLLQHRAWPLWRRLAGLALFCRLADQRVAQGQAEALPGLVDTLKALLDDGGLAAQIDRIQLDTTALQRQVLDALGVERIYQGLQQRDTFVDLLREAWIGLGVLTPDTQPNPQASEPDFLLDRFRAAARDHCQPFFAEREYLLENYLVNLAFQKVFPCRPHGSLFKNLLTLALPYALLRYFLIGSAAYHGGLDEARFIRAVYAFSRRIEHHNSFLKHILELLERNGYDTPAGLVALVKDV